MQDCLWLDYDVVVMETVLKWVAEIDPVCTQPYPFMSQMGNAEAPSIPCQEYTTVMSPNLPWNPNADVQAVVSAMHIVAMFSIALFTSVAPLRQSTLLILLFSGIGHHTLLAVKNYVASKIPTTAPIPTTSAIAKAKPTLVCNLQISVISNADIYFVPNKSIPSVDPCVFLYHSRDYSNLCST